MVCFTKDMIPKKRDYDGSYLTVKDALGALLLEVTQIPGSHQAFLGNL